MPQGAFDFYRGGDQRLVAPSYDQQPGRDFREV